MSNGRWYNSEELTRKTAYIHPNRALTDMREQGYDIEYEGRYENGRIVGYWRLKSTSPIREPKRRRMLSKKESDLVFKKYGYRCALCRTQFPANLLRADHKLPISRGGDQIVADDPNWLDKFQCLCHWCNYEKREICKVCEIESCIGCELYDPLKYSGLMLKLTPQTVEKLTKLADNLKTPIKDLVYTILNKHIKDVEG